MTTPTTKQTCQARKVDGTPCRAYAGYDDLYCYMHSPERTQAAQEARSAGGKHRARPAPAAPIDLSTPELQRRAIEETINRVRRGDEPINVARFVIYAISVVRAIGDDEILRRLEVLEEANAH